MSDLIQFRRGTSAQWATANPVLAAGEPGLDTTTGGFKIGDGATTWAALSPAGLAGLRTALDPRYVAVPTDWVAPALTATWVNVGGANQVVRYRKIGDEVYIEGHAKSGTSGTTVFTLPSGFLPPLDCRFPTDGSGAYGFIIVTAAGAVSVTGTTTSSCSLFCNFSTV